MSPPAQKPPNSASGVPGLPSLLVPRIATTATSGSSRQAFKAFVQTTPAHAIFILGDLFEVWVGDDGAEPGSLEAECVDVLRTASQSHSIFVMHGNRDFLLGPQFAQDAHITLILDPTLLVFADQRWLLTHGDALCLADVDYQAFRQHVRGPLWQQAFLAQPLAKRRAIARDLRQQSEQRKQSQPADAWVDADASAARSALQQADALTLIHGHTHQAADHDLGHDAQGQNMTRVVLSDWDAAALPPRLQVLRLTAQGLQRHNLAPDAGHDVRYRT